MSGPYEWGDPKNDDYVDWLEEAADELRDGVGL